jgi:hypothetical protein
MNMWIPLICFIAMVGLATYDIVKDYRHTSYYEQVRRKAESIINKKK